MSKTYWGPFVCGNAILTAHAGTSNENRDRRRKNLGGILESLAKCRVAMHPVVRDGLACLSEPQAYESLRALRIAQELSNMGPSDADELLEWIETSIIQLQTNTLEEPNRSQLVSFFSTLSRLTTAGRGPICTVPLRGTRHDSDSN